MQYPTIEDVEAADRLQLCKWQRFLPSPGSAAISGTTRRTCPLEAARINKAIDDEVKVINRINDRVKELGGFTAAISKAIGWDQ